MSKHLRNLLMVLIVLLTVLTLVACNPSDPVTNPDVNPNALHVHSFGEWESTGDGTHSRKCSCNEVETADCVIGSVATCTKKAVCNICGGEVGELDATNHASEKFVYTSNNDGTHTKKYECCGAVVAEKEECVGGLAVCNSGAVCMYCNTEYGEKDASIHASEELKYESNNNNTHNVKRACCDILVEENIACSGGEELANCKEKAKCDYCKGEHGALNPQNHATPDLFTYESNGDEATHMSKYACCGVVAEVSLACEGGVASCNRLAKCDLCKAEYGTTNPDVHVFENGELKYDETTHWRKCEDCDAEDTENAVAHKYSNRECVCGAYDNSPSKGLEFTDIDEETCALTGRGSCADSRIIIPKEHNGKKVVAIGSNALGNTSTITSIEFEEGIELKIISEGAFKGCLKLEKLIIPHGVEEIGSEAFKNCVSLKILELPTSVVKIGKSDNVNILQGCTSLEILKTSITSFRAMNDSENRVQLLFGHFFGSTSMDGCYKVTQSVDDSRDDKKETFYIPESLKVVIVTGHDGNRMWEYGKNADEQSGFWELASPTSDTGVINEGSFQGLKLDAIVLGDKVTKVAANAFRGTTAVIYKTAGCTVDLGTTKNGAIVCQTPALIESFMPTENSPKYDVTFDKADGNWSGDAYTVEATTGRVQLPEVSSVKAPEKMILDGWKYGDTIFKAGTVAYVFDNTTFTAHFIRNYEVNYSTNLADVVLPEKEYTTTTITLPEAPASTDADYGFLCWTVNGSAYQPGEVVDVKETFGTDVTVEATFRKLYVITFSGENVTAEPIKVLDKFNFPAEPTDIPEGKMFAGWMTESDDTYYQANDEFVAEGDLEFIAIWADIVEVSFAGEGTAAMEGFEWACGKPYTLAVLPTELVDGKAFIGWSDGNTTYFGGTEVDIVDTVVFTAVWYDAYTINPGERVLIKDANGEITSLTDKPVNDFNKGTGFTYSMVSTKGSNTSSSGKVNLANGVLDYNGRHNFVAQLVDTDADEINDALNYKIDFVHNTSSYKLTSYFNLEVGTAAGDSAVTFADAKTVQFLYKYNQVGTVSEKLQLTITIGGTDYNVKSQQVIADTAGEWNILSFDLTSVSGPEETDEITKISLRFINEKTKTSIKVDDEFTFGAVSIIPAVSATINVYNENLQEPLVATNTSDAPYKLPDAPQDSEIPNGYYFAGWAADLDRDGVAEVYAAGATVSVIKDTDFYADFRILPTATFYNEGAQFGDTITSKDAIELPASPEALSSDYYFGGWEADVDGDGKKELYDANEPVTITEDTDFTAKWIKIPVATFTSENEQAYEPVANQNAFNLPAAPATVPADHYFGGWAADLDGDYINEVYSAGSAVTITEDTEFTAKWIKIPVATFTSEGAEAYTPKADQNEFALPASPEAPSADYYFGGWLADSNSGLSSEPYAAGDKVTIIKDTEFKAIWILKPVATFVNTGDADVIVKSELEFTIDFAPITVPSTTPFFGGWAADLDGDEVLEYYKEGDKITITADTIFIAVWVEGVEITLDNADADPSTKVIETVGMGLPYTLPTVPSTAPANKSFVGWTDGTTDYNGGATVYPTEAVTYTAVWSSEFKYEINPSTQPLALDASGKLLATVANGTGNTYYSNFAMLTLADDTGSNLGKSDAGSSKAWTITPTSKSIFFDGGSSYMGVTGSISGEEFKIQITDTPQLRRASAVYYKLRVGAVADSEWVDGEVLASKAKTVTYKYKYTDGNTAQGTAVKLVVQTNVGKYTVTSAAVMAPTSEYADLNFDLSGIAFAADEKITSLTLQVFTHTKVYNDRTNSHIQNGDTVIFGTTTISNKILAD